MAGKNEVYEQELDLDNPGKPVVGDDFEDEVEVDLEEKPKRGAEKVAKEPTPEEDDLELEIVDDTPEEDRGRKPLPEDKLKELEEDTDVEEYSEKVRRRIDQMRKAWHDERRAKEAAFREREEAVRIAQTAYQERQQYMERLQQGETWALEQAKERAKGNVELAKRQYREAYESGDTDKVMEAQEKLNSAMIDFDRMSNLRPQYQQPVAKEQQPVVQTQQPQEQFRAPEPDARAKDWGERNTWFGKDKAMTGFALGVHDELMSEGITPQTDEYYEQIDARMKKVFPEKFGAQKKRQSSTVVAPVGRSPKGKKVVLTQSQVAVARRLGITPEQYARELMNLSQEA